MHFSDPILNNLHQRIIEAKLAITEIHPAPPEKYFEALCESIVSQQLSVKVADIIFGRLKDTVGENFSPQRVITIEHDDLRSLGLSNAKSTYIKNIAEHWLSGSIVPEQLVQMEDETVIEQLIQIKGVGRWTAEMFLIFTLGRPDIFSVGDYGLKKAISLAYNIPMTSKPTEFLIISEQWQPHRSLASRILWKSLDI